MNPSNFPPSPLSGKVAFSRLLGALSLTVLVATSGCVSISRQDLPIPQKVVGEPGHLIAKVQLPGAPRGSSAWRVLYVSRGLSGEPIPVSGVVIVPDGTPPKAGRETVAWAHPTTGVQNHCAPSLEPKFFERVPGLNDLLARGYVVAATDYPGLGTPETHPYLVGISESRAVLDSVRAAGQITPLSGRYAVWGHSQGGHAGLFAGQLAAAYAPEFKLKGIAVAAPATNLAALLSDDISSQIGKILGCYTLWSWCRIYGIPQNQIFDSKDDAVLNRIVSDCIVTLDDGLHIFGSARHLTPGFVIKNPASTEPWESLLQQNTPGSAPAGAPLFIAQGTQDPIVNYHLTVAFVEKLRKNGETVRFVPLPGVKHHLAGKVSASQAVQWITDRFSGQSDLPGRRADSVTH